MSMTRKLVAGWWVAAMLSGCASGGGGGGSSAQSEPAPILCIFVPIVCILAALDAAGQPASAALTPQAFTTWAELEGARPVVASSIGVRSDAGTPTDGTVTHNPAAALGDLAALGQPGIDRHKNGVYANPYALGWNYQSFGAWNEQQAGGSAAFAAASFGQATPGSAVPTTGNATFVGKAAGFYVSPTGEASVAVSELSVKADFSARSLGLATSGTTLSSDLRTPRAAPHLDVSGTLTYGPGSSRFAGTLRNAGGTMSGTTSGQFYGPAAQELGGAFVLKSGNTRETYTGAYGGKR